MRGHRRWPCIVAGARERGAPESPVFCGAKNAPNCLLLPVSFIPPKGDTAARSCRAVPKESPWGIDIALFVCDCVCGEFYGRK
jgi:hypothetical protein